MDSLMRPKLLMVGDAAVGKTSLVKGFNSDGSEFDRNYTMTTLTELTYKRLTLPGSKLKIEPFVYDLPSEPLFAWNLDCHVDDAEGHVFVFDVTRRETLDSIVSVWAKKFRPEKEEGNVAPPGVLVANKIDLSCRRDVDEADGAAVADQLGLTYVETSAKNRIRVMEPFLHLCRVFAQIDTGNEEGGVVGDDDALSSKDEDEDEDGARRSKDSET